jgi:hypothetical protein
MSDVQKARVFEETHHFAEHFAVSLACCLLIVALCLFVTGVANAQTPDPSPVDAPQPEVRPALGPFPRFQDWSFLRDPSLRIDPYDRLKFIPLNESGTNYPTLSVENRTEFQYLDNNAWGAGRQDPTGYVFGRLMPGADLRLGDHVRIFVTLAFDDVGDKKAARASGKLCSAVVHSPDEFAFLVSTPPLVGRQRTRSSNLREASVDEQLSARDVAAVIRCEKHNGVGDLVCLAEPVEGYGARDHLPPLLTRFGGSKQLIESRRVDGAGADRVDANSPALEVRRPRSRERADGRLRGAINAVGGQAFAGHNGRVENDRGAFRHQRERFLYREQYPFDVDVENGIK